MTLEKLSKLLKKEVHKGFGRRCKDFCISCVVCQVWLAVGILEEQIEEQASVKRYFKKV